MASLGKNGNGNGNGNRKSKSPPNGQKKNGLNSNSAIFSALQGKNVEVLVAALLLTGKLNVDSVTLYRQATLFLGLTGKYKTLASTPSNVDNMVKFLNDNGNMTLDQVIQAFSQKVNN
ncbi:hypothetical protein [Paenibacillus sp. S25]|uniref:hypothetical protein n=1 Tax=Paenibacillus sp. S25 TaxID=2823905 RepID=UPI001C648B0C|nr:hypothetical protein [Paenibacillus sp. S25]QYK62000.1 hypothetical protein KAI37_02327 [Paenibacillus sp. S25]